MADKPIFCGNGRKINTKEGAFRSVSICLSDIPKEHITKSEKNGKSYVNLNISDMDEKNQWGNDVFVTVDTWKPDPNYKKNEGKKAEVNKESTDENLPF